MYYDVTQIYEKTFSMTKVYPNFVNVFVYKESYERKIAGFEPSGFDNPVKVKTSSSGSDEEAIERSLRRTKTTISDIVLCNNFDMFATFTFSKDRQDISKLKTRMQQWLQSQQKTYGTFKYLIVAEYHKDKKAIHFHALLSGYRGQILPACKDTPKGKNYCNLDHEHKIIKTKKGNQLFNIKSYQSGFSTVAKIDHLPKVANYVKKYIQKDMQYFPGKKRYWCSQGLTRPYIEYNSTLWLDNPLLKQKVVFETENLRIINIPDIVTPLNNRRGISWQNQQNEQNLQCWQLLRHNTLREKPEKQAIPIVQLELNWQTVMQKWSS